MNPIICISEAILGVLRRFFWLHRLLLSRAQKVKQLTASYPLFVKTIVLEKRVSVCSWELVTLPGEDSDVTPAASRSWSDGSRGAEKTNALNPLLLLLLFVKTLLLVPHVGKTRVRVWIFFPKHSVIFVSYSLSATWTLFIKTDTSKVVSRNRYFPTQIEGSGRFVKSDNFPKSIFVWATRSSRIPPNFQCLNPSFPGLQEDSPIFCGEAKKSKYKFN